MVPERVGALPWLTRVFNTDFCPWANRFVGWLREPIGWFVLATLASLLIGVSLSPIGWTLAASLVTLMVAGMLWPLVAVHGCRCHLTLERDAVHEGNGCPLRIAVRNRLPFPAWGLAIEGYVTAAPGDRPLTAALASVPPLCSAEYFTEVRPALRGHYPVTPPTVSCSFPFGIWTARRKLVDVPSLIVWPRVVRIRDQLSLVGQVRADSGDGVRPGRSGDFVGVRGYRRGDSAKHVHWVASARTDSLMVTERSGPQRVVLDVHLDTSLAAGGARELNDRVRVAATLLLSLHRQQVGFRLRLGDVALRLPPGGAGKRVLLDALAAVPLEGRRCEAIARAASRTSIRVSGTASGEVRVELHLARVQRRGDRAPQEFRHRPGCDLDVSLSPLWQRLEGVHAAA